MSAMIHNITRKHSTGYHDDRTIDVIVDDDEAIDNDAGHQKPISSTK